jgi:acyl carrier protein
MTTLTTCERLQQILADDYKLAPDRLAPSARLDELGVDSLGVMELMFKLEDEFRIRLPSERAPLSTVGEVADYIDRLVAEQSGASASAAP